MIATIRSREISASIILQSQSQLKTIYKDAADTITGNCDSMLFMGGKCILQVRGVRPFFSDKYDITKHPRYKYLADADKGNTFDIEKYLKRKSAVVKMDEPFELFEISGIETKDGKAFAI